MTWRCFPPKGYGTEAPGTVTNWVRRKFNAMSLSWGSVRFFPERPSCRMGTVEAL